MDECEIWISMNEEGAWVVSDVNAKDAAETCASNKGGAQCRTALIVVRMRPPVDCEAEVDVPDEAAPAVTASA